MWIKKAFRDYYKPKLKLELKRDPSQEEMDQRFEEIYSQVNCILLAGVLEGVAIYFYEIARFTKEELHKLLRGNRADPQMKFIIELALETALRRSEIANIKPEHWTGNMLKVVKAKVKPRTIPLTKRAQQLLRENLPIRKSANAILMMWKRLMKYGAGSVSE